MKRLECSSVKNLFDNVVGSHCSAYDIFDHFDDSFQDAP